MMKPCTSFASNTSIYEDVDEYLDGRRKSSVIVVRKGRIPPRRKKGHIPPRYIALTVPHESSAQIFDDLALNGVANAKLLMRCASAARDRANVASATRARRSVDHRHSVSRASFTSRKSMSRASVQLSGVFHNDPSHSRRNLHKSSLAASHTRRRVSNRNNSLLNCSSLFIRFETSFAPSSPNSDVLLSHSSLKLSGADFANGARRDGPRSPSVIRNEESVEVSPERAFQPLAPNLTSAPLDATHPPLYPRPSVVATRAGREVRRISDAKPSHPPLAPKPRKSVVINAPVKPLQQQQQRTSLVSTQSAPQRNAGIQRALDKSKPTEPSAATRVSEVAKAASEAIKAITLNTAQVKAEQTPRPTAGEVVSARSAPRKSSKADPAPTQPSQVKNVAPTGNGTRGSIAQPSSLSPDKSTGARNVLTTSASQQQQQQQQKQTSAAAAPAKPVSAKPSSTPAPVPPKPSSVRNSMVSSSRNGSLVPPRPVLPMKDRAVQKPKSTTNSEPHSARSAAVATSSRTAPDSETHVLPALKARNTNSNVPTTKNNNNYDHKQPASSNGVVTLSSTDSQTKASLPSTRISTAPPRQQAQQQEQHRSDVMSTTATIHPAALMPSSAQVSSESAGGTTTISGSCGTTTYTTTNTTTNTNTTTYTSSPSGFSYHKHNNSNSTTPPFTPSPAESGQNSPQSGRVHPVPSSDVNSLAPSSASPGNTGDNMDLFPFTRLHVNAVTRRRRTASHIKPFNSDASQYDYNVGTPNTTTSAALRPVPSHDTDSVSNRAESMFEAADFDSPLTDLGTKPIPPTPPQPLSHAVPSHYSRNLRPLLPSQPPSPLPPSSRTAAIAHGPRIITNATVVPRDSMDILTGAADEHTERHNRPARVPPVPPLTTTHISSSSPEALHSPVCVKKDKSVPLANHALPTPSSRSNSPGASLTQTIAFESQDDVRRASVNDTRSRTPSTAQPNTGSRPKANLVQPTMSNHNHVSPTQQAYTSASNGVGSRGQESTKSVPRLTSRRQRRVSEHAHGRHLVINQL